MKNIHMLPTEQPSRLYKKLGRELKYSTEYFEQNGLLCINQNIYITSDDENKEGDWCFDIFLQAIFQANRIMGVKTKNTSKKIILTTDQDLIADGVQAIDDKFLKWFVKNPSCEDVEVELFPKFSNKLYGIVIPKEEPKQEALEEAAEKWFNKDGFYPDPKQGFISGAKWQQEVSQDIVPFDAYNIEVFKIEADENGELFAYIGYRITNGNFHFSVVPFTEPQQDKNKYSEEEVELIANEMVNWAIANIGNPNPQSGKKFDEVLKKFRNK